MEKNIIKTRSNRMNKKNLGKLSKKQLIKLLMKEYEDPLEKNMKKIRKVKRQTQKAVDAVDEKYSNLASKMKDFIVYPKMTVSLNRFRKEELKLSNSPAKRGSSFAKLFGKRLNNISGERVKISITLFVDIRDGMIIEDKTYGPFSVEVPRLSNHDMYKFMVYTLLDNNFTLLSAQEIVQIGCKIITHRKEFFYEASDG